MPIDKYHKNGMHYFMPGLAFQKNEHNGNLFYMFIIICLLYLKEYRSSHIYKMGHPQYDCVGESLHSIFYIEFIFIYLFYYFTKILIINLFAFLFYSG